MSRRPAYFPGAFFLCLFVSRLPAGEFSPSALIDRLPSLLSEVPQPPEVTEAEIEELEDGADAHTYIFLTEARAHPPKAVNLGGDGVLSLTRAATGESVRARYRGPDGLYNKAEMEKISRVMRCSLTGKTAPPSEKLLELLDAVEDHFGGGLTLLSGYRTPRLNRKVAGAARRSMHMLGWAADIRVSGQTSGKVAAYARRFRSGGVGHYPLMDFTHIDAGAARSWSVRRSSGKAGR